MLEEDLYNAFCYCAFCRDDAVQLMKRKNVPKLIPGWLIGFVASTYRKALHAQACTASRWTTAISGLRVDLCNTAMHLSASS